MRKSKDPSVGRQGSTLRSRLNHSTDATQIDQSSSMAKSMNKFSRQSSKHSLLFQKNIENNLRRLTNQNRDSIESEQNSVWYNSSVTKDYARLPQMLQSQIAQNSGQQIITQESIMTHQRKSERQNRSFQNNLQSQPSQQSLGFEHKYLPSSPDRDHWQSQNRSDLPLNFRNAANNTSSNSLQLLKSSMVPVLPTSVQNHQTIPINEIPRKRRKGNNLIGSEQKQPSQQPNQGSQSQQMLVVPKLKVGQFQALRNDNQNALLNVKVPNFRNTINNTQKPVDTLDFKNFSQSQERQHQRAMIQQRQSHLNYPYQSQGVSQRDDQTQTFHQQGSQSSLDYYQSTSRLFNHNLKVVNNKSREKSDVKVRAAKSIQALHSMSSISAQRIDRCTDELQSPNRWLKMHEYEPKEIGYKQVRHWQSKTSLEAYQPNGTLKNQSRNPKTVEKHSSAKMLKKIAEQTGILKSIEQHGRKKNLQIQQNKANHRAGLNKTSFVPKDTKDQIFTEILKQPRGLDKQEELIASAREAELAALPRSGRLRQIATRNLVEKSLEKLDKNYNKLKLKFELKRKSVVEHDTLDYHSLHRVDTQLQMFANEEHKNKQLKEQFNNFAHTIDEQRATLKQKKNLLEIYSDTDASEFRKEEIEIEMDNSVIQRFQRAFEKGQGEEEKKFSHKRSQQLSPLQRQKTMAENVSRWFDSDKHSDPHQNELALKQTYNKKRSVVKLTTTEVNDLVSDTPVPNRQESSLNLLEVAMKGELLQHYKNIKDSLEIKKNRVGELIQKVNLAASQQGSPLSKKLASPIRKMLGPIGEHTFDSISSQVVPAHVDLRSMDPLRARILEHRAQQIIKQMKVFEIGKNSHKEIHKKLLQKDPDFLYQEVVSESKEVSLPLLSKVIDCKLVLKDYTLDSGHLRGLASAIQNASLAIDAVYFDNCGIDDEELAILLEGFLILDKFETFVYKNNVFREQGLAAMKPILVRPDPRALQELRLVNCVTHPKIIQEMLDFMVTEKVKLRSISLVRMQIDKKSLEVVAQLLDISEYLEDLDLSYNNLLPHEFTIFFEVLAQNKSLRSLNLSNNTIVDKADQNNEVDFQFKSLLEEQQKLRKDAVKAGKASIEDTKKKTLPEQAIHCFSRIIRFSRNIQSLILQNCGLNAQVLSGLIPALRHAKSLLCLHLGSNPGISEGVEEYYRERLKVLPEVMLKIKVTPEYLGPLTKEEEAELSPKSLGIRNHKVRHYREWQIEEISNYLNTRRIKPLMARQEVEFNTDSKDLTITRILERKELMPGNARWRLQTVQEQESCWLCDNWIYTLYFWNEKIGQYNERNYIGIDSEAKKTMVETVREYNKDVYRDNESVPVLFSSTSSWQPRPFMTLLDFLQVLSPIVVPPFDSLAINNAQQYFEVDNLKDVREAKQYLVEPYVEAKKTEMRDEWLRIRKRNAPSIIKAHLKYKKPALINFDKLDGKFGDVYVTPIFLPPGKNDFLIRAPKDLEVQKKVDSGTFDYYANSSSDQDVAFRWYYRRHQSNIREERVPLMSKQLKVAEGQEVFERTESVFVGWKPDTEKKLKQCLEHDMLYWKMKKVCGNKQTYEAIMSIVKARYQDLKEIFIASTIESMTPPDMHKREFFKFCQSTGLVDNQINSSILDGYFIATNFEEVDQEQNDDNALNRFEFIEILVRIARGKYLDFGKETQLAYALMKLMQTYILPMKSKLIPLQSWREEHLWCHDVNDLIQVNMASIQRAYELLISSKFVKQKNRVEKDDRTKVSIDKIRYVFVPGFADLDINDTQIIQAFYSSKMTVVNENEKGNYEYTFLHWPEFLEFLGRLAWLKYIGTHQHDHWPLAKKMKVIIEKMLEMFKLPCKDPPELREVISESDDEY